jgi:hypothetical protein
MRDGSVINLLVRWLIGYDEVRLSDCGILFLIDHSGPGVSWLEDENIIGYY